MQDFFHQQYHSKLHKPSVHQSSSDRNHISPRCAYPHLTSGPSWRLVDSRVIILHQTKQCTSKGEILQNHHTFAFFDLKMDLMRLVDFSFVTKYPKRKAQMFRGCMPLDLLKPKNPTWGKNPNSKKMIIATVIESGHFKVGQRGFSQWKLGLSYGKESGIKVSWFLSIYSTYTPRITGPSNGRVSELGSQNREWLERSRYFGYIRIYTPLESNIDTQNDGLENGYFGYLC